MSQLFVSCKDWFSWLNHFYVSNANYIINNWKVSSRHFPLVNILVGLLFNYQDLSVMWKRFWWFKRIRNFLAIREKKLQIKLSGVVALITVVIGNFHPNWTFSHASNVQQSLLYTAMVIIFHQVSAVCFLKELTKWWKVRFAAENIFIRTQCISLQLMPPNKWIVANYLSSFCNCLSSVLGLNGMLCAIWCYLYTLKNEKNTHGGVLLFAGCSL